MRKRRTCLGSDHNLRPGSRRQFAMPADKIGVQVGLDHISDAEAFARRLVDVLVDVPLRIDHCRLAAVADQIRGVGKAA